MSEGVKGSDEIPAPYRIHEHCKCVCVCVYIYIYIYIYLGTAVEQWLRCCATNRKVAGSIPDGVIGIFH